MRDCVACIVDSVVGVVTPQALNSRSSNSGRIMRF